MSDGAPGEPALLGLRRAVRRALAPQGGAPSTTRPHVPIPVHAQDGRRCVVAVALSGGADSLALLGATAAEAPQLDMSVVALVVDHGLQPESAAVAARAAATAITLGAADARVLRAEVGHDGGPEAAARSSRYDALGAGARAAGASVVLLGHTRDDQAETVLLGIARGSGARSLSGMRADHVRGDGTRFLRPLLHVPRTATRAACAELAVTPWEDPHNIDPAFTRVRVRTEAIPLLEDVLGPGVSAALARTADQLRDDADALDAWAEREWVSARCADGPAAIEVAAIADLPAAVRRRILRRAALAAGVPGGSLTAEHLGRLDALVAAWSGQGPVALPGPVEASRACGRLTFRGR